MRRDVLAAGAHKAQFAGGVGESDIFRNVAKDETTREEIDAVVTPVEPSPAPKLIYKPVRDNLLVRRIEVATSSVLITDTMEKEKPAEGIVLAAGPKSEFAVGTHLVFGKYSGTEFKLNGEVLLLLTDDEVTGTLVQYVEPKPEEVFPRLETVGYIGKA